MKKIEGYWHDTKNKELRLKHGMHIDTYPIPIANVLTKEQAAQIYNLIKKLESKCRCIAYKGSSYSRITGEQLGNVECENKDWKFPADFSEHYVLKHRVKPTDEFLRYIGYK